MILLKVNPILVGPTPLEIAIQAQIGIVFLLAVSIKALFLCIDCVAIITRELKNTSFMDVSGSPRPMQWLYLTFLRLSVLMGSAL